MQGSDTVHRPMEEVLRGIWAEVLGLPPARLVPDANFFLLGGDSLAMARICARVEDAFALRLDSEEAFPLVTLARMSAHVRERLREASPGESGGWSRAGTGGEENRAPASAAQAGLWFLRALHPEAPALYNTGLELLLSGPLRSRALHAALAHLAARHEALRTGLRVIGKSLEQRILPQVEIPLPRQAVTEAELAACRARFINAPFALHEAPLLRALLLAVGGTRHHLLLCLHHAVTDGGSGEILLRELAGHYNACLAGKAAESREAAPAQYREFCRWQQAILSQGGLDGQRHYWLARFAGTLDPSHGGKAPAEHRAPHHGAMKAERLPFRVPGPLHARLACHARESGLSLYMLLLAAFMLLLRGGAPVTVGTPVANRRQVRWEGSIGYFVNMLALRVEPRPETSVTEFLAQVRRVALEAFSRQDLPFQEVVRMLKLGGEAYPLFNHLFVFHNKPLSPPAFTALQVRMRRLKPECCHYPLTLELTQGQGALEGEIEYHAARFRESRVEAMLERYVKILYRLVENTNSSLSAVLNDLPPPVEFSEKEAQREERAISEKRA